MSLRKRVLPASEFFSFDEAHRSLLTRGGAVPVNDLLLPIWEEPFDIALLYGGRGGGKSEGFADRLLDSCLTDPYFKCYYGRKVFDTVRGSCFATLVESIKKNKLEHEFSYSEAETSTMVITCRRNGNKFIPFGSDKAEKLKSIKDPTHVWCEEFDQFEFNDFKDLYPTLRTPRGANQFIATFNTHAVLPTHWILKIFFPDLYEGDDKDIDADKVAELMANKKILKIFINFTDNYFIDQEAYRQTLWIAAAGNFAIFQGIAEGAWGIEVNDSPWLYAFDRTKHVAKQELFATKAEILYLSWDFNRNPQVVTIMQWPQEKKLQIIEVIKEKNVGTEGLCERVLQKYPGYLYMVTGDYSGDTVSSVHKEHVTNYTMIKKMLNLGDGQIRIQPNPPLERNQTLVNSIFYLYPVEICPVKAKPFIFDAERVKKTPEGKIDKTDRKDPAKQADVLDTVRYWCNKFMGWFVKLLDK